MKKCLNCYWCTQEDKLYCEKCGTKLTEVKETVNTSTTGNTNQSTSTNPDNGFNEELKKKNLVWKVCSVILIVIMFCIRINATEEVDYWEDICNQRNEKISSLQYQLDNANEELNVLKETELYLKEQTNFMDNYIGIIDANSDSNLYHKYFCEELDWDSDWSIRVFNIKRAEIEGYSPCSKCY